MDLKKIRDQVVQESVVKISVSVRESDLEILERIMNRMGIKKRSNAVSFAIRVCEEATKGNY
jgi:metal-responsive CopG/Arc/MetJ family transcriptional regulator